MKKLLALLIFMLIASSAFYYFLPSYSKYSLPFISIPPSKEKKDIVATKLKNQAVSALGFTQKNKLSNQYCFLIDMSLPSGRNRFFIYDLKGDSVIAAGLVAHGSCNTYFLSKARFSNTPSCGCSSIGKYKVGYQYNGRFGKAFKLFGMEDSNSNAFKRAVVLHAYDCVPDQEIYPQYLCNSLGCPMISYSFLNKVSRYIEKSKRPVMLWIYD
jgi:hypothetical protein